MFGQAASLAKLSSDVERSTLTQDANADALPGLSTSLILRVGLGGLSDDFVQWF